MNDIKFGSIVKKNTEDKIGIVSRIFEGDTGELIAIVAFPDCVIEHVLVSNLVIHEEVLVCLSR